MIVQCADERTRTSTGVAHTVLSRAPIPIRLHPRIGIVTDYLPASTAGPPKWRITGYRFTGLYLFARRRIGGRNRSAPQLIHYGGIE